MNILDLIFPKRCLNCLKFNTYLCPACLSKIPSNLPECFLCRRISNNYKTHSSCTLHSEKESIGKPSLISTNEFHPYSVTILWKYGVIPRKILTEAKYHGSWDIYKFLECVIDSQLRQLQSETLLSFKNSLIQPIPQHSIRRNQRGFNHTKLITQSIQCALQSQDLATNTKITEILIKTKNNKRQAAQTRESRAINTKDVFEVQRLNLKQIPLKSRILLVDDVITTGATISEAAKCIKSERPDLTVSAIALFRGKARFKDLPTQNPTGQIVVK